MGDIDFRPLFLDDRISPALESQPYSHDTFSPWVTQSEGKKITFSPQTGCSNRVNLVQTGEIFVMGFGARRRISGNRYEWSYSMENSL